MLSEQLDVAYNVYATLLDGFTDYLNSDLIWERYWGWSENPPHTVEQFREKQFKGFIDRINRLPFDSEAASKGTAFNEIVDCLVEHRKPREMEAAKVWKDPETNTVQVGECSSANAKLVGVKVKFKEYEWTFDIRLLREFADYFKGALTQQLVEGILPTEYGNVRLYGYIDELMPQSVHDIKTTGKYAVGKFKEHAQHLVYPYCLMQNGADIRTFEYNVAELDKYGRWETYTETYVFDPGRDIPVLRSRCEQLICFLKDNRQLITDKKIAPIWGME